VEIVRSACFEGPVDRATVTQGKSLTPPFSVSVVIPLFNKERAIACTLRSVLQQERLPDELIVVDDGSTDSSTDIVRQTLQGISTKISWRLVTQENAGVSVARNRGARESRSRYIAFLDGDDEWLSGYLAEVERLATAFPAAGVLSTRSARTGRDGMAVPRPSVLSDQFFGLLDQPIDLYRKGRGIFHSSSVTIKKDAWDRCEGFPVGAICGEDIYLWLKLALRETIAHSGAALSINHAEHSTEDSRTGVVVYYLAYFLGTSKGHKYLSNRSLRSFVTWHLLSQIVYRRQTGDLEGQNQLNELSRALPTFARIMFFLASVLPVWSLEFGKSLGRYLRT